MHYRVRYVCWSGPVTSNNIRGWPHSSKKVRSLFTALKLMRDIAANDPRVGDVLGLGLQLQLFPGEPWKWISAKDVERYAADMRVKNWKPLLPARAANGVER